MSKDRPEKRSFLHSGLDGDSGENLEKEMADWRAPGQVLGGTYGLRRNSYITHDFRKFRATKADTERNVDPEQLRAAEGSFRSPSEGAPPATSETMSRSSYSPQESVYQSTISDQRQKIEETSGETRSHRGGDTKRSSVISGLQEALDSSVGEATDDGSGFRVSRDGTPGEASGGTSSLEERRPSLKSSFSDTDRGKEDFHRRTSVAGGDAESRIYAQSPFSEIDFRGEGVGGVIDSFVDHRNDNQPRPMSVSSNFDVGMKLPETGDQKESSTVTDIEGPAPFIEFDSVGSNMRASCTGSTQDKRPSVQFSSSLEIDALAEEEVRVRNRQNNRESQQTMSSLLSDVDAFGEEVDLGNIYTSTDLDGRRSMHSPFSFEIDTSNDDAGGSQNYRANEAYSSAIPPLTATEAFEKRIGGTVSDVSGEKRGSSASLEMETFGESTSGVENHMLSKRRASGKLLMSDMDAAEEVSRRDSFVIDGSERQPPRQTSSMGIDIHRSEPHGTSFVEGGSNMRSADIVPEIGVLGETGGFGGIGSEWPTSGTFSEIELGAESRGSGYVGNDFSSQPQEQPSSSGTYIFKARQGSISGSYMDAAGDKSERSNYVNNCGETSSAKSTFSDRDIVLEECARESYKRIRSGGHLPGMHRFLDEEGHGEGSDRGRQVIGDGIASWPSANQPLLDEVQSDPFRDVNGVSVNHSRRASRPSQLLDMDSQGDEAVKSLVSTASERSHGKEQVADEQLEPMNDRKRLSVIPNRRLSRLSPPSDVDRDPESLPDVARGRGSLSHSIRRASRVFSPSSEGESAFERRDKEEDREVDTPNATSQEPSLQRRNSFAAQVGERVPPEWALLLLGCLLGLATGLSVVIFNKGVHLIHDMAWAGTPREGAAWLRLQRLIDIWHRVMLIPVVGGVMVGMMHAVVVVLDQVKGSRPPIQRRAIDWLAGVKPTVRAGQAMVTLGTGCSLGPEGPSVDIGKAWAHGLATVMKNSRERRIALVAAGAAAGISAGFNAPVSGMFFAIETVLRPQHAENSPPLTTAMIILASVISSTVSQVLLEETAAFTVPIYELRSAAELPLYLLLGGVCGVVSVIFTRLAAYFTEVFEFLRDQIGIPHTVTPAIGGLVTGLIALRYPGVLYWGFSNVDEILHSGKTATAPGAGLVTQLICAKVAATAFCKGSGLVGGVYAPSLFIGAAVGSVYGTLAGKIINAALPGHDTVAHPQAYALVGMAALLAAVCSVPLTSVLLLFELTKDYHILLPLMGGIGVAIWVAAVAKQSAEKHFASPATTLSRSFRPLSTNEDGDPVAPGHEQQVWRRTGNGTEVELCFLDDYEGPEVVSNDEIMESVKVSQAMSKTFVKVQPIATVKETIADILLKQQRCALVVDENDLIEGIFTFSDLESEVMRAAEASAKGDRTVVEVDKMLVAAVCSGKGDNQGQDTDLVVCFPDVNLNAALEIMESSGFKQLPVVARAGRQWQDEGRQIVGLLSRDAIPRCIKVEASKRISEILAKRNEDDDAPLLDH